MQIIYQLTVDATNLYENLCNKKAPYGHVFITCRKMLFVVLFLIPSPFFSRKKYLSVLLFGCLLIIILDNQSCLNEFEQKQSVKRPLL